MINNNRNVLGKYDCKENYRCKYSVENYALNGVCLEKDKLYETIAVSVGKSNITENVPIANRKSSTIGV